MSYGCFPVTHRQSWTQQTDIIPCWWLLWKQWNFAPPQFLLHQMGLTRVWWDVIAVYGEPQHLRWKVSELGKACLRQVNTLMSGAQVRKIHPMSPENYPAHPEKPGFTSQRTCGEFLFPQSLNFTSGLRLEEVLKHKGKSNSLEPKGIQLVPFT